MLGYTGTYHGVPVSVQTTGMGTPSFSIVMEELLNLGVTRFIRAGTCGGISRGLRTGDLVICHCRGAGRWRHANLSARRPVRSRRGLRRDTGAR